MHTTLEPSRVSKKLLLPMSLILLAFAGAASAQCDECTNENPKDILLELIDETGSDYLSQSPQNLQMMNTNPAYFVIGDGKALYNEKRGPNNASLEQCDFGQGPGVLEGAYAKMPRYFEDTGKVMHLEARLVHCMKTIQGFTDDHDAISNRSEVRAMMAYVAAKSNGYEWDPPMDHPMEKAMRDAGEAMFYRRSSKMDFSCNTCHSETGKRIRGSVLPNVNVSKEWTKAVSWPAKRVGRGSNVRSPYQRVRGCYWQMRKGELIRQSAAATAMFSFWTDAARGEPAILPDLKR